MFACFDLTITEEEVDAAVLGGHYTLQAYATTYWLDHVKEGVSGDMVSEDFAPLCKKMWIFLTRRANQNFDRKSARKEGVLELKHLEKDDEHIYQELCYINSSLASELSDSPKSSKKDGGFLSSLYTARQRGSCTVQIRITWEVSGRRSILRLWSPLLRCFPTSTGPLWHCTLS